VRVSPTAIPEVLVIDPVIHEDERGFFVEAWHAVKYRQAGIDRPFVQDNQSRSSRGVLRGLHYQIEQAQGKLVRVTAGEVFDVAVDLRRSSPTFGRWTGVTLSGTNQRQIWVPPGFAHGFYVTSDEADVIYKCTDYYDARSERTLRWDDRDVGIRWPLLEGKSPLVSAKDAAGLSLRDAPSYA
jgi:dTDP-4-dehydrorhamnose 3,5-epimerase